MSEFGLSFITSTIVSGTCSFIYYRREIGKQKVERQRNWDAKMEDLKEKKPILYERIKDL